MEEWASLQEFNRYLVSTTGRVVNQETDRELSISYNHEGVAKVTLIGDDGRKYCKSLGLLIVKTFTPHNNENFNNVVHLNGDRTDLNIDNLVMRPRWFAILYNRQFKPGYRMSYNGPLRDKKTGFEYRNSMDVSTTFGILDREIFVSVLNRTYVFPTSQVFEFVE